jgi:hypothetical protein
MYEYILRVRLQNGSFTEMPFRAISLGFAIQIAESQFGKGNYLGVIRESYVG